MSKIVFMVPGNPVPLARARVLKSGHAYLPKRSAEYRRTIQLAAKIALPPGHKLWAGPVDLTCRYLVKRPKSRPTEPLPIGKPDKSNLDKAIEDALNGLVWIDDAQIVSGGSKKWYADGCAPCTEVEIELLSEKEVF